MTVHVLAVVPGEPCPAKHLLGSIPCSTCGDDTPDHATRVPPSVWESPNGPIPLTCERCHGEIAVHRGDQMRHEPPEGVCDHCDRGAPVIDWQMPCQYCTEPAGWLLGEPDHYERGTDAWIPCECNPDEHDPGPGVRPVRVSIQAVPIVDEWDEQTEPCVIRGGSGRWYFYTGSPDGISDGDSVPITLPEDAEPGMFAIIGTEVK